MKHRYIIISVVNIFEYHYLVPWTILTVIMLLGNQTTYLEFVRVIYSLLEIEGNIKRHQIQVHFSENPLRHLILPTPMCVMSRITPPEREKIPLQSNFSRFKFLDITTNVFNSELIEGCQHYLMVPPLSCCFICLSNLKELSTL